MKIWKSSEVRQPRTVKKTQNYSNAKIFTKLFETKFRETIRTKFHKQSVSQNIQEFALTVVRVGYFTSIFLAIKIETQSHRGVSFIFGNRIWATLKASTKGLRNVPYCIQKQRWRSLREKPGLKKITSHYPFTKVVLLLQKRVYNVKVPYALPLNV